MGIDKQHIRHILHFEFDKVSTVAATYRNIRLVDVTADWDI